MGAQRAEREARAGLDSCGAAAGFVAGAEVGSARSRRPITTVTGRPPYDPQPYYYQPPAPVYGPPEPGYGAPVAAAAAYCAQRV